MCIQWIIIPDWFQVQGLLFRDFPIVSLPQWLHCLRWGHGNPNFPATGSHSKPGLNVEHIMDHMTTCQFWPGNWTCNISSYNLNSFYSSISQYTFHELFRSRSGNTATSTKEHHPGSSGHPCCGPWTSTQWTRHVLWPPRWHLAVSGQGFWKWRKWSSWVRYGQVHCFLLLNCPNVKVSWRHSKKATISYWAFKLTNNDIATIRGWCNTIDVDANCLSLSIVRHEDLLCQNLTPCLAVKPFWLRSKVANADTRSQPHFGEESLCWWCASYHKHHVCRDTNGKKKCGMRPSIHKQTIHTLKSLMLVYGGEHCINSPLIHMQFITKYSSVVFLVHYMSEYAMKWW